jgi:tartronate-semialdehyde synthase
VPYVLVMVNNGYMGLIRQAETAYDMNFEVDLAFDHPESSLGVDHVGLMEAMGALGRRVTRPEDIRPALEWAVGASQGRRVPALVEVVVERETNAAMGTALDKINEYELVEDGAEVHAGQLVGALPASD